MKHTLLGFCLLGIGALFLGQAMSRESEIKNKQQYMPMPYGDVWYQTWYTQKSSANTPIIMIHGGPGLSHRYMLELKDLAHDNPVIFYDQSGCDNSHIKPSVTVEWTFDHYAQELAQFIEKLGLKKVILVGYSWGAALALDYAAKHQQTVEKLVLASPYMSSNELVEGYKQRAKTIGIYDILVKNEQAGTLDDPEYKQAMDRFSKQFVFRGDWSTFGKIIFTPEIYQVMFGKYELSVEGNLKDLDLMPLLNTLTMPVLLTAGKYDTMTPDFMERVHARIPNSKLVTFEHSAHMPQIEEKEQYLRTVQEFLLT